MKTAVFRHTNHRERLGSLASVLEQKGGVYEYIDCFHDDLSGFDALAPDLLIVTGGAPGVYQSDVYPFLRQEIKIIEKRLAAELPVFGICLGAQLMAAALGARNYKGSVPEIGWHDVHVNEAGMRTPLRHVAAGETKIMQWHQDTFDLPQGAVLLATSRNYENQAFSWGRHALGVQFHPEMTPRIINSVIVESANAVAAGRLDAGALRLETSRYAPRMMEKAALFFSEWLDIIVQERQKQRA